ncbi:MAG: hypothetical protein WD872_09425 [Pirellulaceae bacterium]
MGTFLSMSATVGASPTQVVQSLNAFAEQQGGLLEPEALTLDHPDCLVVAPGKSGASALFPRDFVAWNEACAHLSSALGQPTFSFHIHDGDLWMYELFEDGKVVDQFNPIPEYWEGLDPSEVAQWKGDAAAVSKRVPNVSPQQIDKYLVPWTELMLQNPTPLKAYPADQYPYCVDWQMTDFLNQLGFVFPDEDVPHCERFRFQIKRKRRRP